MTDHMTTSEVSAYLRVKERTIYDLVARKEIPCSRATGKLLFPRNLVDRWIEAHIELQDPRLIAPPPIIGGSSDPLLEWALRESGAGLAGLVEGSSAGLVRLAAGGAVAAGIHFGEEDKGENSGNIKAAREASALFDVVVVHWAWRQQCLLTAAGNPLGLNSIRDAAQKGARFIPRQDGSGTEILLDRLLAQANLSRSDLKLLPRPAQTQTDVALAILDGHADCGIAVSAVARRFNLAFVPLHRERFDLACRRRELLEPPLQKLFEFARTPEFKAQADRLGDYDASECGKVLFNR
ncbi:DNA-binding protein [Terrihabitans soli]|uniref:DNA-binding protein n=1 Tax=Terrihabitans soli TaxID=708113 RepID=A0A6S6QKM8_9HYPH|nr:helix-turn-helix transcriptional regulator [Terrihabitans soli]BCJ91863.1 DNA-binding protein [Terrihabitans soli]